jgi:hypothetical protein
MVNAEQRLVSSYNDKLGTERKKVIDDLNDTFDTNAFENFSHGVIYGTTANSWAKEAMGSRIDFDSEKHRVAIGQAAIFAEHGYSKAEYLEFVRTGNKPKK